MSYFDKVAKSWDNDSRIGRANRISEKIINSIPNLENMIGVEYGCGTGLISFNLKEYLKDIYLVDNSKGMLDIAKEKINDNNIDNMIIVKGDLLESKLNIRKCNIIYTSMALHHIVDTDLIIKEFYKLLEKNGYLCIIDLYKEDGSFHGKDYAGHNGFDINKLSNDLFTNNFKNIIVEQIDIIVKNGKEYPTFFMMAQK